MAYKELNLSNPIHAREFILTFRTADDKPVSQITMKNGRIIVFSRMSDVEAVLAAKALSEILAATVNFQERH